MAGIAILGMYLQYKSWKASKTTKRIVRGGKEKPNPTAAMRSRRVILNDRNARISTGSDRGKATPMPVHNPQS